MSTVKTRIIKTTAVVAAALMLCSGVTAISYAATQKKGDTSSTSADSKEKSNDDTNVQTEKNETVYVLANTDGSVKKIIVSDWIKNGLKSKKLSDKTELNDVKNVNGNESFTMDTDSMRVWNADGNDVYYQGTISKALPVDMSVTYKLDGKTVSPDSLAGKSGKVTMRFDYSNNQYSYVDIDGKKEKIYVPFVMLTGMLLDNESFKNVEVTNGKVINDGSHIAVVGFALPGLQDNLGVNKDKFEIPDYVEITADVTKFKLSTTMTLAANNLFNEVDTDKLDKIDDLQDSLKTLTDSMSQLINGSSQLYNGLSQLLGKSKELIAGVDKLSSGSKELAAGADSLSAGLKELVSNNNDLNGGAATVFSTLLDNTSKQIKDSGLTTDKLTIENYKKVLNALISNPNATQTAQLIASANKELESKLTDAGVPKEQMTAVKVMFCDKINVGKTQDVAIAEITPILKNAVIVSTANAQSEADTTVYTVLTQKGVDKQTAGLLAKVCSYLATVNKNQPIENLDSAQALLPYAQTVMEAGSRKDAQTTIDNFCLKAAKNKAKPLIDDAVTQLDSYNKFYQGVLAYTAGATKAYSGSKSLSSGAAQLNSGIGQLKDGSGALIDGVQQLSDGSKKVLDGLNEFNEKGIRKISSLAEDELGGLVARIKATVDVSKSYKTFAGKSDDVDGNVKFIYKTDEIK